MSKFQHDVMLRVVKLLDVFLVAAPFAVCWFFTMQNISTFHLVGWDMPAYWHSMRGWYIILEKYTMPF